MSGPRKPYAGVGPLDGRVGKPFRATLTLLPCVAGGSLPPDKPLLRKAHRWVASEGTRSVLSDRRILKHLASVVGCGETNGVALRFRQRDKFG